MDLVTPPRVVFDLTGNSTGDSPLSAEVATDQCPGLPPPFSPRRRSPRSAEAAAVPFPISRPPAGIGGVVLPRGQSSGGTGQHLAQVIAAAAAAAVSGGGGGGGGGGSGKPAPRTSPRLSPAASVPKERPGRWVRRLEKRRMDPAPQQPQPHDPYWNPPPMWGFYEVEVVVWVEDVDEVG